jgi:hypothetical protein
MQLGSIKCIRGAGSERGDARHSDPPSSIRRQGISTTGLTGEEGIALDQFTNLRIREQRGVQLAHEDRRREGPTMVVDVGRLGVL